jgi:hypothetical protein
LFQFLGFLLIQWNPRELIQQTNALCADPILFAGIDSRTRADPRAAQMFAILSNYDCWKTMAESYGQRWIL